MHAQPSPPEVASTTTPACVGRPQRVSRFFLGLLLFACLLSLGIFLIIRSFSIHTDMKILRDGITQLDGLRVERQLGVSLGPVALFLARTGLAFADLPREARLALSSARGVELGLYQVMQHPQHIDWGKITRETDARMKQRGWERFLAVSHDNECVLGYAPATTESSRNMRVCLAVLNDSELILLGARINAKPLVDLATRELSRHPGQLTLGMTP